MKCPTCDTEEVEAQTASNMWLWNLFVTVVGTEMFCRYLSISPQIALVALPTVRHTFAPLMQARARPQPSIISATNPNDQHSELSS